MPVLDIDRILDSTMPELLRLGYRLHRRPEVRWDLRGLSAGQARLDEHCIRLNAELIRQEGARFGHETLVHELAHLAVWAKHGRRARPHGPQWQKLMLNLGVSPARCHGAAVKPVRQQRRFRYACSCAEHALSTTRHRRAQRGVRYLCRACHQPLTRRSDTTMGIVE